MEIISSRKLYIGFNETKKGAKGATKRVNDDNCCD